MVAKMMRMFSVLALILLHVVTGQDVCFKLDSGQNQYLEFEYDGLNLRDRLNLKLSFKTSQNDTVLYYAEGTYNEGMTMDYEGLFIRDGKLNYFVFNPTPTGAGSSHGMHIQNIYSVNNGTWVEVQFFRNVANETGMVVNGDKFIIPANNKPLDLARDENGQPMYQVWIGGHPSMSRISSDLETFNGDLKNIKDMSLNHMLSAPVNEKGMYEKTEC